MKHKKALTRAENYDRIRDELDTGDIVLFSSNCNLMKIWKFLSGTHWTHVGIVVRDREFKQILLWESVMAEGACDVYTHETGKGVQCVLLSSKVRRYRGEVAIRRLRLDAEKRVQMAKSLVEFREEVRNRAYEKVRRQILRAFIDHFTKKRYLIFLRSLIFKAFKLYKENKEDLSSLFCSELIAEAYQRMGLLKKRAPEKAEDEKRFRCVYDLIIFDKAVKPSNEYIPEDFSAQRSLELENGASLGPQFRVVCR